MSSALVDSRAQRLGMPVIVGIFCLCCRCLLTFLHTSGSGRDGQGGLGDATARKRTAGQEEEDNARKKARAPEGRAAGACQGRAKEKRPKKRGLSNAGLTADEVMEDLDALLKLFRAAT